MFSGHGRRLTFDRLWVRIQMPQIRQIIFYIYMMDLWTGLMFEKTENKRKWGRGWLIKNTVDSMNYHLNTFVSMHTFCISNRAKMSVLLCQCKFVQCRLLVPLCQCKFVNGLPPNHWFLQIWHPNFGSSSVKKYQLLKEEEKYKSNDDDGESGKEGSLNTKQFFSTYLCHE